MYLFIGIWIVLIRHNSGIKMLPRPHMVISHCLVEIYLRLCKSQRGSGVCAFYSIYVIADFELCFVINHSIFCALLVWLCLVFAVMLCYKFSCFLFDKEYICVCARMTFYVTNCLFSTALPVTVTSLVILMTLYHLLLSEQFKSKTNLVFDSYLQQLQFFCHEKQEWKRKKKHLEK